MTESMSSTAKQRSMLSTILATGLLAGFLDGLAASVQYFIKTGKGPAPVFRFIASGVFGKDAFAGGNIMIIWGVVFHFIIAALFTIFFFLVYPKIKMFSKNRIVTGIFLGIFTWLVMNLTVLPLSNTPPLTKTFSGVMTGVIILVLAIGMPVSFVAHQYYKHKIHLKSNS